MLLSAIPTLSLIDPLLATGEVTPVAGDGFAPLMAALLLPVWPADSTPAPGNSPPLTGETPPAALPRNADVSDLLGAPALQPGTSPPAGTIPLAAPSRFTVPIVTGMVPTPAPLASAPPKMLIPVVVRPAATLPRTAGPVPKSHETRYSSDDRFAREEAEPDHAVGYSDDGTIAPPSEVAAPVPNGADLLAPEAKPTALAPPQGPFVQAEPATSLPNTPVPVIAPTEPSAGAARSVQARAPTLPRQIAEGAPADQTEFARTPAPVPTGAGAGLRPDPTECAATVLGSASPSRPDGATPADPRRAAPPNTMPALAAPTLVSAEPSQAATATDRPTAPLAAVVRPLLSPIIKVVDGDRPVSGQSSLLPVALSTPLGALPIAPRSPQFDETPSARSASHLSDFAATGLPLTSPTPQPLLPRPEPLVAASLPQPTPTLPVLTFAPATPLVTALPNTPDLAINPSMPASPDRPEFAGLAGLAALPVPPSLPEVAPAPPASPVVFLDAAPAPRRDAAGLPSAPQSALPQLAPVILPALHAFGAAIRRALADERQPARTAASIIDPLAPLVGTAPLAPASAPTLATPILDTRMPGWPHAMVDHIEQLRDMADAADTRIRLIPDALGAIDVGIRRDGDTVHVHFTAQQAETRTLLQDAQPRLAEAAEARGLKLGRTDVDAGTTGQGQQHRATPPRPLPVRPASARMAPVETDADTRIA